MFCISVSVSSRKSFLVGKEESASVCGGKYCFCDFHFAFLFALKGMNLLPSWPYLEGGQTFLTVWPSLQYYPFTVTGPQLYWKYKTWFSSLWMGEISSLKSIISAECWTSMNFWRQWLTDREILGTCMMRFSKVLPFLIKVGKLLIHILQFIIYVNTGTCQCITESRYSFNIMHSSQPILHKNRMGNSADSFH